MAVIEPRQLMLKDLFKSEEECERVLENSHLLSPYTPIIGMYGETLSTLMSAINENNYVLIRALLGTMGKEGGFVTLKDPRNATERQTIVTPHPFLVFMKRLIMGNYNADDFPEIRKTIEAFIITENLKESLYGPYIYPTDTILVSVIRNVPMLKDKLFHADKIKEIPRCCKEPIQIFLSEIFLARSRELKRIHELTHQEILRQAKELQDRAKEKDVPAEDIPVDVFAQLLPGVEDIVGSFISDDLSPEEEAVPVDERQPRGLTDPIALFLGYMPEITEKDYTTGVLKYPNLVDNLKTLANLCHQADAQRIRNESTLDLKQIAESQVKSPQDRVADLEKQFRQLELYVAKQNKELQRFKEIIVEISKISPEIANKVQTLLDAEKGQTPAPAPSLTFVAPSSPKAKTAKVGDDHEKRAKVKIQKMSQPQAL